MQREFEILKEFLDRNNADYKIEEHGPVHTSMQAAAVRNVDIKTGVKSLVFDVQKKERNDIILVLVSGDRKADTKKLADLLDAKNAKLASPEEVFEKTGCEVGSVHPFGNLFGMDVYMDKRITENETVNFSAGMHTVSISMKHQCIVDLAKPKICDLSKE